MLLALSSLLLEDKSFSQITQIDPQINADNTVLSAVICCYTLMTFKTSLPARFHMHVIISTRKTRTVVILNQLIS